MKIALQLSLAVLIGIACLTVLRACDPFSYFGEDKFILKGGVQQ